jgi:hypothetical protein
MARLAEQNPVGISCRLILPFVAATLFLPIQAVAALQWDSMKTEVQACSGDQEATAVFSFRNTGKFPVTINSVSTSCGCTTAELAKNTYAPGETGEIKARLQLRGLTGHQEKWIMVATDEMPPKPTILVLVAEIKELVVCAPRLILWKKGESPSEKQIDIVAGDSETIEQLTAAEDKPSVTVRVECLEPGKRYRIWLKPASTAEPFVAEVPCTVVVKGRPNPSLTVYASVE